MNTKKRMLTFLMVLAMIVSLAACGGGKNPAGTYKLTAMGSGSDEMTVDEMTSLFGVEIEMTLVLKDDKSFSLDMGALGDGEITKGTWKMDGDSVILSVEGDEIALTYDGKTIVMDIEGETLTFEKQ